VKITLKQALVLIIKDFFPTYVDNYDICKQLYLSLKEILAMWKPTHPCNAPCYTRVNVCWFSIGCFGYDVRVK